MIELTCVVCEKPFQAKRRDAKTCTPRCRQLARRRTPAKAPAKKAAPKKRAARKTATSKPKPPADRGLVDQTVHELKEHDRLDTFHGQLAVQLAEEITRPGATGVAATSKELRAAMALALEGVRPKNGDGPAGDAEDEVARARAARDAKRRNATRRA